MGCDVQAGRRESETSSSSKKTVPLGTGFRRLNPQNVC